MSIKTFHIITIGCQMNKADSERLSSYLRSHGLVLETDPFRSDLVAINTCGVRQSAEDRAYGLVNRIRRNNPKAKIAIMGCISHRPEVRARLKGRADIFLANRDMEALIDIIESGGEILPVEQVREMNGEKYLAIAPDYENNFSAFVPIGNGCDNFCSYCVVPYARGRESYRPAADIIKEAKRLAEKGYREITLIAQNVNSYRSGDYDFARLLREVASLPGDFWVRFSSSHPKDLSDYLIEVIGSCPKVCPHLHLAVQSGDDKILARMNRKYTAAHYVDLISKVRQARPGIAITTDVIVGFPGETEEQFQHTVDLFEQIGFDMAYTAQYSPRPHTAAWEMEDDVPREEKGRREAILNAVLSQSGLEKNRNQVGQVERVLVEGKDRHGRYYGKTAHYKSVRISGPDDRGISVGEFIEIEIIAAADFGLEGWIVEDKKRSQCIA